ncbi:LOC100125172 protein, related [Eimeria mitis]|uniref:peptidyl-tRNA hydrolase n=1 Tax=Eimeria mitis TaxID=44415 RepID=U6K2C8_9EIME|nr:LOC100125172 protein, related [Eimeria mitis]CDJ31865.1 LOC100125172 protein, related [Eimeria mitis]
MLPSDTPPTGNVHSDAPTTGTSSSGEWDPLVQYVVVRRDLASELQWPLGAVVAQACHAAVDALGLAMEQSREEARRYLAEGSGMRTVVLQVSDEGELLKLREKLVQKQARNELSLGSLLPETPPDVGGEEPAPLYDPAKPATPPQPPPTRPSFHRPVARDPVPAEAQFATWKPPLQPAHPRSLTVALIGPPNAGKSSLLNAFLGVTVSAVSNKVNTTRTDFRGMVTKGNCQLVFVDAPGIIESHPKRTFCKELVNAAWRGYEDADLGILVIDTEALTGGIVCPPSLGEMWKAGIPGTVRHRLAKTHTDGEEDGNSLTIPILLCLNKIDLASHPKWIRAREKEFQTYLFCWFNKDVPYRITQQTVGWSYQEDGSIVIEQELLVRTAQVAKMICGVRGRILLQMRKNVTYRLEQLWGCRVHLNIFVKVSGD